MADTNSKVKANTPYDVHCAHVHHPDIVATAFRAFAALVARDQKKFGGQFLNFTAAALAVLSGALRQVGSDAKIQAEYTDNLLPLIYGHLKPYFAEAFAGFEAVALALLATFETPSRNDSWVFRSIVTGHSGRS